MAYNPNLIVWPGVDRVHERGSPSAGVEEDAVRPEVSVTQEQRILVGIVQNTARTMIDATQLEA